MRLAQGLLDQQDVDAWLAAHKQEPEAQAAPTARKVPPKAASKAAQKAGSKTAS